jgi:Protein of unknown function (DUF4239)
MPLFLYDLPNWLLGLVVTGGWVAAGAGGHALLHGVRPIEVSEGDRNLALTLLGVVATVNSLLVAFAAIAVWETYSDANQAVSAETTAMVQLAHDLSTYDTAGSQAAQQQLKAYARAVVDREWPAMRKDELENNAWQAFDQLFRAVGKLEPATPREVALMPQIWSRANELVKFRRDRLDAMADGVPATLWIVVVLGTALTLVGTWVLPRTRFNQLAIAMLSCAMGLMFFFMVAMDRPFAGAEGIDPEPFEAVLRNMAAWDSQAPR